LHSHLSYSSTSANSVENCGTCRYRNRLRKLYSLAAGRKSRRLIVSTCKCIISLNRDFKFILSFWQDASAYKFQGHLQFLPSLNAVLSLSLFSSSSLHYHSGTLHVDTNCLDPSQRRLPLMAPKATSTSSTRLYSALVEHQRHVHANAGPTTDLPTGSAHGSEQVQATTPQTPVTPFTGGRKPTSRSMSIVSMQDSAGATSSGAARRETDQTTTWVSNFMFGLGSRIWSRAATSQPGHSPTLLSQTTVDATHSHSHGHLRSTTAAAAAAAAASAAQPKFRAPGLLLKLLRDPSWKTHLQYLFSLLVLAHVPIQTFLDFNAVFILIE
jgi:hypothetical protein